MKLWKVILSAFVLSIMFSSMTVYAKDISEPKSDSIQLNSSNKASLELTPDEELFAMMGWEGEYSKYINGLLDNSNADQETKDTVEAIYYSLLDWWVPLDNITDKSINKMLSWNIDIWNLKKEYNITENSDLEEDITAIVTWDYSSILEIDEEDKKIAAETEYNYKVIDEDRKTIDEDIKKAEAYKNLSKTLDELTWELKKLK